VSSEGDGRTQAWRRAPFSIKSGRTVWSGATDGNWIVFVKKDLGLPAVDTGYQEQLLKYLQFSFKDPLLVELGYLKEFTGPLPDTRDFDIEDQRRAIFFRVVVNLKRLACLLEPLQLAKVSVWDGTPIGLRCIGLSGEDWRIVLGGLDREPDEPLEEDEDPIPTFEVKSKGVSAFDAAMNLLEGD